ncbi:MAG: TRZ/ATZ family hydrolase [Gammaproteobacteria bacterium]
MQKIDTLLLARWVIPIEPHNKYYEHHAVAIDRGRIVGILPNHEAETKYEAKNKITLSDHVILPGLINAHTHSPMTLFRGLADDLVLMDWLNNHIWPAESAWLSEAFVRDGTELALAEMIKSGTTCFNEHYFYPEQIATCTISAKMRARIGIHVLESTTAPGNSSLEKAMQNYATLSEYARTYPGITLSLAPHAPYSVSDHALQKIKTLSDEYQLPIHIHMHETTGEIQQELAKHGKRPLRRLHELGLLSPRFQAVHMTQVNDEDIALLQETGATIIHCPESNLKLASGFCPVQRLLNAHVLVALGTDGAASNNDLDMLSEMRTAALLAKATAQDATALSAAMALRMATLDGARVLQLDREIGSLEAGKAADIIAVNLNRLNTQPVYNPISQLVYAAHSDQVTDVWVAGVPLLRNSHLTTLDEINILTKAKDWQQRIKNEPPN